MSAEEKRVIILSRVIESGDWPDINGFIQAMMRLGIKVRVTIDVPEVKEAEVKHGD